MQQRLAHDSQCRFGFRLYQILNPQGAQLLQLTHLC
jgi:hypothetical protein